MALRVWLPLNGTLENKGISGPVTQTTAPTYVDGKIGKAMSTGAFYIPATEAAKFYNNEAMSFCFWIYPIGTENSGIILGQSAMAAGDNRMFSIFQYPTPNDLHLSWQIETATNTTFFSCIINGIFTANVWTHCAITYNGSQVLVYKNGTLSNTYSCSKSTRNNFSYNVPVPSLSIRYLNDLRIYDHCLSAKEVKEIAQGLVLHYKLDGWSGGASENLLLNSNFSSGTTNNWYGVNSSTITHAVKDGKHTGTGTKGTSANIIGQTEQSYSYIANSIINLTVSADVYVEETGTFGVGHWITTTEASGWQSMSGTRVWNSSSNTLSIGWNHISTTLKNAKNAYNGKIVTAFSYTGTTFWITNVKLELGSISTPYSQAPADIGIDITKITDSSGYGNDGTIVGTLTAQQDTKRYGVSTAFAASSAVNCGRGAMVTDSITVNIWSKYSTYSNLVSCTEGGGWNFENNSGLTFPIYISSVGYVHIDAASRPAVADYANSWHMFTGTYDRLKQLTSLYVDGVLIGTGSVSSPNQIQYNSSNVIWINAEATGSSETASYGNAKSFSDFRIYATALSAEDILDLYHTSANADNLGGLHGFEFIDNINNRIMEANGTIATKNWNNSTLLKNYQQTNCQVTLTDDGLRIYRPPNYNPTDNGNTMWGGMRINNTRDGGHPIYGSGDNPIGLEKGHTYIIAFHVKGKSSNATNNYGWSNQMGWGGGGLGPTPTDVSYDLLPSNFNGEKECWYKWTINDDIVKTCTTSYSYAVAGNQYMSYADFAFGWQYQDTGALGSDVYITNLRLYDITNLDISNIQKNGVINFTQLDELTQTDKTSITFYKELQVNNFIEK